MVAVLALVAAWVGSDVFVLRRVQALATVAQRVAEGELDARTGLPFSYCTVTWLFESGRRNGSAPDFRWLASSCTSRCAVKIGNGMYSCVSSQA